MLGLCHVRIMTWLASSTVDLTQTSASVTSHVVTFTRPAERKDATQNCHGRGQPLTPKQRSDVSAVRLARTITCQDGLEKRSLAAVMQHDLKDTISSFEH